MKNVILNIVHSNVNGGLENVYLDYSEILHKNFEVVCVTSGRFVHLDKIRNLGIKTEILNIKGHYDVFSFVKLCFLIRKYSPKLVIAHNGRSFSIINLYSFFIKKRKFKTVAISHGGNPKRLIGFDYIITVAKHIERKIKEKYKYLSQDKIFTIHNGIKIHNYRKPVNRQKGHLTFGTLSRLSPEKNIITALKAFKNFQAEIKGAKLLVAGSGKELENLMGFVKKHNLQDNVSFMGHIDNLESFFNQIDVLLHPATKEPFGLVVLEAFNYYTPVIGANSGGLKEIIQHGYNGYLYDDSMSSKLLYDAMLDYYRGMDNEDEMVNNAYKTLEEKFSIGVTRDKLILFVRRAISNI